MRRISIIGSGGAGKSTLARKLGEITGLPVVHLDQLFWKPGWVETPKAEWKKTVDEILACEAWIIDGNFNSTMETRMAASDTVIFLQLSRITCIRRSVGRWVKYWNQSRPDMADGCPEKFDLEFLRWVWTFPKTTTPMIEERLSRLSKGTTVFRLRSDAEINQFLESVRPTQKSSI